LPDRTLKGRTRTSQTLPERAQGPPRIGVQIQRAVARVDRLIGSLARRVGRIGVEFSRPEPFRSVPSSKPKRFGRRTDSNDPAGRGDFSRAESRRKAGQAIPLVQIQHEHWEEMVPSTNRQLDGARKCLHAAQLRSVFAAVWKCTAACETFTVALALVARRKGADPAAIPPTNNVRREISAEPILLECFMIFSLAGGVTSCATADQ
jgi:hypothetical protein